MSNEYVNVVTKAGLAGMRAKPAMYLGSTGVLVQGHAPRALTQMAQEVISNSLDEALVGHGKTVWVEINEDQSMSITDHGRGLPKGPDDTFDAVIRSCTAPHTSGKFDDENYAGENTTGTHGIGLKATNAISTKLTIEAICASSVTNRKGEAVSDGGLVKYYIEFEQDKVLDSKILQRWTKDEAEAEAVQTGTKITFWPDDTILESNVWTLNDLYPRLEAAAFLFPGVEVQLKDNRTETEKTWLYEKGLEDYITLMSKGERLLSKLQSPIVIDTLSDVDQFTFKISGALVYTDDMNSIVETYANGVPTKEGGPHLEGFNQGLLKAINDFATDKKLIKQAFRLSDVTEGLIAAIHVQVPSAIFETEGQTKEKLATVQAKAATNQAVYEAITNFLYDNLDAATEIVEKTESARQAREAAAKSRKDSKASKDAKKAKRLEISSKLKQATSKDKTKRELLITEGDSASNAKRDTRFQAILGLRGKIRNVFELPLSEALKNEEVSTIIGSIGAGVGAECDPEQCNYGGGIFFCCDADDDGSHINTLLLALFYRFMRNLITAGLVYMVVPPLYKAEKYVKGKPEIKMYFTEQELAADRDNLKGYEISRYKGLGEMDSETEAYDAITNHATRRVIRVTIDDAMRASQIMKVLMGNDAGLRADWIEQTIDFDELAYA